MLTASRVRTPASWQTSYRGILPDSILDRIDVGQARRTRRQILRDRAVLSLVAYDQTHVDIVGFCDAGAARRPGLAAGELYAIYLVHHAKRHGIGSRDVRSRDRVARASGMGSMVCGCSSTTRTHEASTRRWVAGSRRDSTPPWGASRWWKSRTCGTGSDPKGTSPGLPRAPHRGCPGHLTGVARIRDDRLRDSNLATMSIQGTSGHLGTGVARIRDDRSRFQYRDDVHQATAPAAQLSIPR